MYLVWNLAGIIDMVTGTNGLAAGIASVILAFDVKCGSSELAALAPRHWHEASANFRIINNYHQLLQCRDQDLAKSDCQLLVRGAR